MSKSEDLTTGKCCTHCGKEFNYEHGYPVYCEKCYDKLGGYRGVLKSKFKTI